MMSIHAPVKKAKITAEGDFSQPLSKHPILSFINCPRRDFAQKAKSRGGTLVTRACIKGSTYS